MQNLIKKNKKTIALVSGLFSECQICVSQCKPSSVFVFWYLEWVCHDISICITWSLMFTANPMFLGSITCVLYYVLVLMSHVSLVAQLGY